MHHHGGVHAVEHAGIEHQDLATTTLFGRCPDDPHGKPELVGERGEGEAGADGGGRDDVVPAGMTDAGQRVVLGADGDGQRSAARGGGESGVEAGHARLDRQAGRIEHLDQPGARAVLLEGELGVAVDGVRERDEPFGLVRHGRGGGGPRVGCCGSCGHRTTSVPRGRAGPLASP